MRSFFKGLCPLLLVALLLCLLSVTALADEALNLDETGSIRVILRDTETKEEVSGGTLTLYPVGKVAEENGNLFFRAAGDFSDCGLALDDVESEELAAALAEHVKDHAEGTRKPVPEGGVVFDHLEPGLYLIVQEEAVPGYDRINPFLVTVPILEDGVYKYDVDATPKTSIHKTEEQPPAKPPIDSSLPQTGQLNWPVPVLTVVGLLLFTAGWVLCFGRRKDGHEK